MSQDPSAPCCSCERYSAFPCPCPCHGEPNPACALCAGSGYRLLLSKPPKYELCTRCRLCLR